MAAAAEPALVRCPSCGATNRVPLAAVHAGKRPVCGRCKRPLPAATAPVTITDANFPSEVESSPLPVLLDMWAAWCGPCRLLAPVVDELAGELAGRVKVGKLNVDENPSIAGRFGVQSIPTLLVLKGGREVDRIVGVVPKADLARRVERAIA
ncbi:MAG TPA: thioredoxin [Methylomirabilota bacterium]|jgi:thioredoxin 2